MSFHRLLIATLIGPELARWKARGHAPVFWWRDDDARRPTPALERLLGLSVRFAAPITIAAVPDGDIVALAKASRAIPDVELAVHGFRHENRAPPGWPSGEVNDLDRLADVMSDLGTAIDVFRRAGVTPRLFVPPWNNAHPTLKRALGLQGLGLSCYGDMRGEAEPDRLDAHLDVMRWKPEPRFRGTVRFLLRTRRLLAERRVKAAWDEPLGLLTHHLDHDEAVWRFLEAFLPVAKPVARTTFGRPVAGRGHIALKVG
ncbi:polysaccharide deacetylase family protein [Caulobacter soli]|uniref:polysaccharide deacetylase family protein n=1 Tax=Caulobacter soli TaxID=2708539 RepID=UPI0013ED0169|nr:polysaccharide deacetylase family protein [Caulobacter soli]